MTMIATEWIRAAGPVVRAVVSLAPYIIYLPKMAAVSYS